MWVEESLLAPPPKAKSPKRGHPLVYPDALIQGLLGLKQVFHLPLRALQGFAQSLRTLAFPTLPVPNYTTLSRRAQNLNVVLPASRTGEPLHLVIDSTGLLRRRRVEGSQERLVQAAEVFCATCGVTFISRHAWMNSCAS